MRGFVFLGFFLAVAAAPFSLRAADEASLLGEVDAQALERHARAIVMHRRDGGSPGENAAVDYVVETLRAEGIDVEVHLFPGYVSNPGRCALRVEGAEPREPTCRTQALAAPTAPGGAHGELVYIASGTPSDYENVDVEGKVVLVNALPLPWGVKDAEDRGAVGAVFMSYSELIQELTVSPIWGTPTHENYEELPSIPSVNINKPDGDALREALASAPVTVAMETEVDTGWKMLKLAVATVESEKDADGFVLVGGHIDGWHYGAVDEGASNAAMVEMARIFHRHRGELERSLKVAWWPAHSNGRYAGSAWYVDYAWLELRDHALAYMNIDGGRSDGRGVSTAQAIRLRWTSSRARCSATSLRWTAGLAAPDATRIKASMASGCHFSNSVTGVSTRAAAIGSGIRTEDTFDKIDFGILDGDTKLYVAALSRLLTNAIPPIRLAAAIEELTERLKERKAWAGESIRSVEAP